jgi:glycosyltransferase involved in cell wall biosynthesis
MPRVIFCNRFYWPDEPATSQLLTDLAEGLAAAGWEVLVVTSGKPGSAREEVRRNVRIIRVSRRLDRRHAPGKLRDFAGFIFAACRHLARSVETGDTVVFMTDPPMLGALAGLMLRRRSVRCLHWVQDIYPEIAITLTRHRWLRVLRPLRNRSWRQAHACITLSAGMARKIQAAGVPRSRIGVIPNWAPVGLRPAAPAAVERMKKDWGLAAGFVVLYSGNLGQVHDLTPIIDAATALRHETDILFAFVGQGGRRAALEDLVRQRRLPNVRFLPPQPRDRLAAALSVGDIHFVTLLPGCEDLVFPSKLHGIAAVGRPMVAVAPLASDLAGQITTASMGAAFDRADAAKLAAGIKALRDDPAQRSRLAQAALAFASEHAFDRALAAWLQWLDPKANLAASRGDGQP